MLTLILLLSSLGFAPQKHVEKKQPFTIVIVAEKDTVAAGADVWIKVTLTNTSNADLDDSGNISGRTGLDPNFQFDVRDEKGDLVAKRRYEHPELDTGNPINRTLKPGESVTQEQRVNTLYDMTRAGKYSIQVSMAVPEALGKGVVKSNVIAVTLSQ